MDDTHLAYIFIAALHILEEMTNDSYDVIPVRYKNIRNNTNKSRGGIICARLEYFRTTTSTWRHIIALYTKYPLTTKPKPTTARIHLTPNTVFYIYILIIGWVQKKPREERLYWTVNVTVGVFHGTVSHFGWKRWYDVIHLWSENLHPLACERAPKARRLFRAKHSLRSTFACVWRPADLGQINLHAHTAFWVDNYA